MVRLALPKAYSTLDRYSDYYWSVWLDAVVAVAFKWGRISEYDFNQKATNYLSKVVNTN